MSQVTVSIINYRTAEMTLGCVESVLEDFAASGVAGDVVIVDNASGDGSETVLRAWCKAHPEAPVRLILSPDNTGFSGGHNQGIAAATGAFVLVLNSDAKLRPGCLGALLDAAAAEPGAGLLAPRLEDEDGTVQTSSFRFPSVASEVIRGACSGPVTRALGAWNVPLGPEPDPSDLGWASFACILLRREMIDAIGPMDEGYFLYFEDIEYSLRARRAGWGVRHVHAARAVHYRGGSGPVKTLAGAYKRLPPYYYASRTRFFYQKGGLPGLMLANLGWILGRAIAQTRWLAGKRPYPNPDREARDIWTNALRPLGPRLAPGD